MYINVYCKTQMIIYTNTLSLFSKQLFEDTTEIRYKKAKEPNVKKLFTSETIYYYIKICILFYLKPVL